MKKLLILIVFSMFGCGKAADAAFSAGIQGFWKVRQIPKNGGTPQLLYAQINDSLIQYWYEEVKYLLPYGYRVQQGDLIIWLQRDPDSHLANVGKLSANGPSGFFLDSDSQRLEFQKSDYETFEQETGEPWRKIE